MAGYIDVWKHDHEQGFSPREGTRRALPPLLKFWKILGGSAPPPSSAKLWKMFLKFFYSAVDLQIYFNICSQCPGRINGVLHLST